MSQLWDVLKYGRVYRQYVGRRMYIVFFLTALSALSEGLGIALLLPLLRATDSSSQEVPSSGVEGAMFDLLEWVGISDSLVGILIFIGIVFAGKGGLNFSKEGYQGYLQSELLRELKEGLFDAYSDIKYEAYIKNNTGHYVNVVTTLANQFFQSFRGFASFFSSIITTSSYFIIAFAITWKFALMASLIGAFLLTLFKYINTYVRGISRKASSEMGRLNNLLVQALQGFKYIVSTNQVGHLKNEVTKSISRLTKYVFRQRVAGAFTSSVKEPLSISFIILIVVLQVLVLKEPVTPIFVSIILFHRGLQSLIGIQSNWQSVMSLIGSVEIVHDEFQKAKKSQERKGGQEVTPLSSEITLENVSFSYGGGESVLENISLDIPSNSTIALVGESGAGKSTLVDMLTLLLPPQSGRILIDGVDATNIDLSSWRSQIGYVSQETVMFDDTVANNISLWAGDPTEDPALKDQIRAAARRAHAHDFIEALPEGYQTIVGDRGIRLSGGQRQRLFIARELFKRPQLLILDEATSALDTESEKLVQESIEELKGSTTIVMIAHRLSTVKSANRIYVLEHGKVIEEGGYSALRDDDESRFREMVKSQSL